MSTFKPGGFKVASDAERAATQVKVQEFDRAPKPVVKDFSLNELKRPGAGNYQVTKAKYGSLAATDLNAAPKPRKDNRFDLSPMMKEALKIDQEEQRVIQSQVDQRTEELAHETRAAAYELGYQEGLKLGVSEAMKKVVFENEPKIQRLEELVREFEDAKDEIYRTNERFLIDLIYRIAKMVLLRDLKIDPEYLLRLTRDFVGTVSVKENITIKISQADENIIAQMRGSLEKAFGEIKNLQILVSNQIQEGSCQVESELQAIDADLETQLSRIHEALVGIGASSSGTQT